VALTRAKYRCYTLWGKIAESESSALAWLLHPPTVIGPSADPLLASAERVKGMTADALHKELQALCAKHPRAVALLQPLKNTAYRPAVVAPTALQARHFQGPVRGQWRISSFSALTAHTSNSNSGELPDYDATPWLKPTENDATTGTALTAFDFPRGARAGRCLHQILENLDFSNALPERLTTLSERALLEHGFDLSWTPVVINLLQNTLAAPLNSSGLRLADIAPWQRLNELEFYYPLNHLNTAGLRRTLAPYLHHFGAAESTLRETLEALDFPSTQGYMKGFIDLVFESGGRYYLADYKSNWLGEHAADYQPERLSEPMSRAGYILQYLIYTVALHRYLKLRLQNYDYQHHFGGVYYLYLRGMDPALPGYGVYSDWPDSDLIQTLDKYFS
jgi:exodeoxyribonuclease V beta subunit